ncbi:formylglycine-generating enzyme family protein [Sphingomonas crocodyli]|uniref:Sulfatase-modifying factor enzyme-like domain-containing protein n=1 Tax=Sphingomonas crocodyli TaxID=1979270 RepID=A0A437M720_9SPHN|nr:SUMF1/EgtB/PvdO family nonheme iron enzyme [Sphingomonas crocodyli]RVT93393.1 hypothetical protein EOD43_05815 [Sphingomonas crocodyli]
MAKYLRVLLLMWAAITASVSAYAQDAAPVRKIVSGQPLVLNSRTMPFDHPRDPIYCMQIDTQPGQVWELKILQGTLLSINPLMYFYFHIGATPGAECKLDTFAIKGEGALTYETVQKGWQSTRRFVAGGGPYLVVARSAHYVPATKLYYQILPAEGGLVPDSSRKGFPITVTATVVGQQPDGWEITRQAMAYVDEAKAGTASETAAADAPARKVGSFRDCEATCPEMVVLPTGGFLMGSTSAEEGRKADEGPVRRVAFARPFAIGKYEVSFDEWAACAKAGPCRTLAASNDGRRPVANISWYDARAYADWLSKSTGQRYFLPSEAEWEYAARAGTTTPWNTGDAIITDDANILGQFNQSVPTGGFPANGFGVHDMHGNVAEWVIDCHAVGYFRAPADGSAIVMPNCADRVVRGGSYASDPAAARSAARKAAAPLTTSPEIGFRVARAL